MNAKTIAAILTATVTLATTVIDLIDNDRNN